MEKANLSLYTAIGDPEQIATAIQKYFKIVAKDFSREDNRIVTTLQDDTNITVTVHHQATHPGFITPHTQGMANYFSQAETPNGELKQNVLRQIQCFNCVAGIVFEMDDNTDRTNYITNTLFDIAGEINGFLLYPNMCIYNGQRQLVFSAQGESDLTTFTPTANADLLSNGRPDETEADKARQERSITLLKAKGIPYITHLPAEVTEQEAALKSREEMLRRATALFAVAVYSEVLLSETPDREEALGFVDKLDEIYHIKSWLTPSEAAYIGNPAPAENECIQFVWRYECCGVLLWAAGVTEELPYPSDICDVPIIAELFWQHKGIDDLLSKGIPRSETEILDAADLTLRYDWACVDARVKGKEAPAALDGGIVMERHYAFNWITGANAQARWDDIQPNT